MEQPPGDLNYCMIGHTEHVASNVVTMPSSVRKKCLPHTQIGHQPCLTPLFVLGSWLLQKIFEGKRQPFTHSVVMTLIVAINTERSHSCMIEMKDRIP